MVKCAITGKKIPVTFLGKPLGTPIKINGKIKWVSADAQAQYGNDKEKLIAAIK